MGERLTDEELESIGRMFPTHFGEPKPSVLIQRMLTELRERRAKDMTTAEVDAIRELRANFGGTHYTEVTKRALAVLDRLLNQELR
jgi:hypothetical protein